jgi:hypothetical protein
MDDTPREILVTSALPYTNGPIHLGHLVEYIDSGSRARRPSSITSAEGTSFISTPCSGRRSSRKMRFGVSEGMVLAAGPGGNELFLLSPDSGAEPGIRVK